jgi:hypothetical protein
VILRDKPLFRTLRNIPTGLLPAAFETIEAIEKDWPNLPGAKDVEHPLPPAVTRWRRRIAASSWWVVYSWSPASQTLILRTVNDVL